MAQGKLQYVSKKSGFTGGQKKNPSLEIPAWSPTAVLVQLIAA